MTDWYERRHELQPGMVFRDYAGDVVRLDRHNPGDGTQWIVDDWSDYAKGWTCDMNVIEPGDLIKRLSDDYSGEPA